MEKKLVNTLQKLYDLKESELKLLIALTIMGGTAYKKELTAAILGEAMITDNRNFNRPATSLEEAGLLIKSTDKNSKKRIFCLTPSGAKYINSIIHFNKG